MSLEKSNELIRISPDSFEDAAREVVSRAHRTLRGVTGLEVSSKDVGVGPDGLREYRVRCVLSFAMAPETVLSE